MYRGRFRRWSCSIAAIFLLVASEAVAQKEFNVWCLGDSTGLDFNRTVPGPVEWPTVLSGTGINTYEGMACISDRNTGELLFYSDGRTVWNREHHAMPNGEGLKSGSSSTQAALIVPMPGDSTQYYLFTCEEEGRAGTTVGAYYSIVDMEADGGLGDVITRNTFLLAPTTEKLVAVPHCNGTDFWVITHTVGDNSFHTFLITAAGISPAPVVSSIGAVQLEPRCWLAAAPNGRMLASSFPFGKLELFDFDPCTGVVSNVHTILQAYTGYGVVFSPDNSKLYGMYESGAWQLVQFDLADNDRMTVLDTIVAVRPPTAGYLAAMQIGPDGRIYCARVTHDWLSTIEYPNAPGLACNYRDSAISLNGRNSFWGLPNVITGLYRKATVTMNLSDTVICAGECISVTHRIEGMNITESHYSLNGSNGKPGDICYDKPGRYRIRYVVGNYFGRDTADQYVTVNEGMRTVISTGSVSGRPGDIVEIPVIVRTATGEPLEAEPYTLRFSFNGTLLYPVDQDSTMVVTINGSTCTVIVSGISTAESDTLYRLRMLAALGNAETTPIALDTATLDIGCADVQITVPGEFRVDGICREGSTRLFMSTPESLLKSSVYDRGSGTIQVRYRLSDEARGEITLADMLGRTVTTLNITTTAGDEDMIHLNASQLPAGTYFCTLRAGGRLWSMPVQIQ